MEMDLKTRLAALLWCYFTSCLVKLACTGLRTEVSLNKAVIESVKGFEHGDDISETDIISSNLGLQLREI